MARPLALMIHSLDSPVGGVSKLLEARDCSVHVSRSLEEAERVLAAFPADQLKYVFADLSICHGPVWSRLTERLRGAAEHLALICYDPKLIQTLYGLLGHSGQAPAESNAPQAVKTPTMIGDTPQFHEILKLANRYAMHDITVRTE